MLTQKMDSSAELVPLVFFGLLLAFGLFTFFRGFLEYRDSRLIADTPRSKCRSLALGLVEVAGTAVGDDTFPSLIAQIPCYCSHVVVEQYVSNNNGHRWQEVSEQKMRMPFYVEDETGRVKVAPADSELSLERDLEYTTGEGPTFITEQTAVRLHQGPHTLGDLGGLFKEYVSGPLTQANGAATLRFRESNLCPGDPVFVLGTATELSENITAEQERILIRRGDGDSPFYVAESSPKEFLARITSRAKLRILAGGVLSAASVMFLVWLVL